ncbi:LysB family phage lysis regulatory protein [Pseudomonas leptonychotis]|uniref:LysB family phage lysis regulatory protein n=1 Tax=Pseudomonas leptonychotis TaxID=2448482 RepID=A0A4V4R8J8_9PSED|nr:Rz-like lysis system protein LysB [Pseudomonas leptonychotis]TIH10834.1 LysB family phage lysis regulatory protein [Pseudomonas leptonychotis]
MTTLRQLGYGLALFAALGLLAWGQYQQGQAVDARETLAAERQLQAEQRIERQATTITAMAATLEAERTAQTALRTTQNQLRQGISQREQQIEALKRENSDLRAWATQPLPSAAQRLRKRPAISGANAYRDWLSGSGAVQPATQQPER